MLVRTPDAATKRQRFYEKDVIDRLYAVYEGKCEFKIKLSEEKFVEDSALACYICKTAFHDTTLPPGHGLAPGCVCAAHVCSKCVLGMNKCNGACATCRLPFSKPLTFVINNEFRAATRTVRLMTPHSCSNCIAPVDIRLESPTTHTKTSCKCIQFACEDQTDAPRVTLNQFVAHALSTDSSSDAPCYTCLKYILLQLSNVATLGNLAHNISLERDKEDLTRQLAQATLKYNTLLERVTAVGALFSAIPGQAAAPLPAQAAAPLPAQAAAPLPVQAAAPLPVRARVRRSR